MTWQANYRIRVAPVKACEKSDYVLQKCLNVLESLKRGLPSSDLREIAKDWSEEEKKNVHEMNRHFKHWTNALLAVEARVLTE